MDFNSTLALLHSQKIFLSEDVQDSNKTTHENIMKQIKSEYLRKKEAEERRFFNLRQSMESQEERIRDARINKLINAL